MIDTVHIRNYRAIRDLTVDLRPFNVIIGPNDTGKTTFLQAVHSLGCLAEGQLHPPGTSRSPKIHELLNVQRADQPLVLGLTAGKVHRESAWRFATDRNEFVIEQEEFSVAGASVYALRPKGHGRYEVLDHMDRKVEGDWKSAAFQIANKRSEALKDHAVLRELLAGIRPFALIPNEIARPVPLVEGSPTEIADSGWGVARILLDMKLAEQCYDDLVRQLCSAAPTIEGVRVRPVPPKEAGASGNHYVAFYEYRLRGSQDYLPASCVSDGVLLLTAFLALSYSEARPSVLLIEEPENGVHPQRLEEVFKVLKSVATGVLGAASQVILTTHSPYLPDLADPDEVLVFTRDDANDVQAFRMSALPDIKDRTKYFTLGELVHTEGEEALAREARQHASARAGRGQE